jgi:hypothetical protein
MGQERVVPPGVIPGPSPADAETRARHFLVFEEVVDSGGSEGVDDSRPHEFEPPPTRR